MKEAGDYRSRAALCITFAATTDDEAVKAALIDMAQKWHELVDRSELAEPPPSPSSNLARTEPGPKSGGKNAAPQPGAPVT